MLESRLDLARDALRSGQLDHADVLIRSVLADDPSSVDGLNILGTVEIRRSRPDEAIRLFTAAAVHDATPKSAMNRARAFEMAGDRQQAIAVYQDIVARFPDHAQARALLLRALLVTGAIDRIIRAAGPSPETLPIDADVMHGVALAYLNARDQPRAERLLARALAIAPLHSASALLLASLFAGRGDRRAAVPLLRRVVQFDPANGEAASLLGEALATPAPEEALAWLRRANVCSGKYSQPHLELATLLHAAGRHEEAVEHFRAAGIESTDNVQALDAMAQSLLALKRNGELVELAQTVLDRVPSNMVLWNAFAVHLKTAENKEEAVRYLRRAVILFPAQQILLYNLGATLNELMHAEEAEVCLRRAVRVVPTYAKAWNALSVSLSIQFRVDEAEQAARTALRFNPKQKSVWLNTGIALRAQGRMREAVEMLRQAIALDPKYAEAHHNLAHTLLMTGEIEQGFRAYDWRWGVPGFPSTKRPFRLPVWSGQPLGDNDGLLLYMEQGMGDEIMFSWYLHLVSRHVKRIIVECEPRLIPLFARSFPQITFVPRQVTADRRLFDPIWRYKAPVGHLPKFYWSELREHIQSVWHLAGRRAVRTSAYLKVDLERREYWRTYFRNRVGDRPLVGISWRSGLHTRSRDIQYLAPEEISRAFGFDVAVVNLQYGSQPEEIEAFKQESRKYGFHFIDPEGIDLKDDLDDVMALISALDLVVTPLISVAWMAGALGVPTWVFRTSEVSCIWQQMGTPLVPWTPSLRLFFRHPRQAWDGPLDTVRDELEAWLKTRG